MRWIIAAICTSAALLLIAASLAMNWTFWTGQGLDAASAHVLGAVSIGVDLFKAMLPLVIAASWERGQRLGAVIAAAFFCGCLAFSLFSAIGFAASTRGAVTGSREAITLQYQAAERELKDVKARLESFGGNRPAATVAAAIDSARQDRRWESSKACTEATAATSRSFCMSVADLQGELATATEAEALRDREVTLQNDIDRLITADARREQDPQAGLLARISGLSLDRMQTALTLLLAVLVEIGAAFGLFLARLSLLSDPSPTPASNSLRALPPATRFLRGPDGQLLIE